MKWVALALLLTAAPAAAQDTVRLSAVQQAAVSHDPRARQLVLQERASELRLRNVAVGRLPSVVVGGQGSYQSEVPRIPIQIEGIEIPQPPLDRYQATVDVEQLIYDNGVLNRQRGEEEAKLASSRAQIEASLYPLRAEVNAAFFQAFQQQQQRAEIGTLIDDLEAKLALVRAQADAGAALPGDTAAVLAELLAARQNRGEAEADLRAALSVLADLTGEDISGADVLALPDLEANVARVRAANAALAGDSAAQPASGVHPRYAVFAAQREELRRQSELLEAQDGPRVSAFGEWGYGRPGLRQFTDEFHDFWLTGVKVTWQPWNWRTTARKQQVLTVQAAILDTEEAAFTAQLRRQVQDELETMDRLVAALATDDQIIALREQVERQAEAQLGERAITPAAYVDVRTNLQDARLAQQRHRVELAQARADYLTTLGVAPW